MVRPQTIRRAGTTLALGLLLAGCNGYKTANTKNFSSALNYYYSNNDDCLFPSAIHFPYEASTAADETDSHKKGTGCPG